MAWCPTLGLVNLLVNLTSLVILHFYLMLMLLLRVNSKLLGSVILTV